MPRFTGEAIGMFVCLSIKPRCHSMLKNWRGAELRGSNSWWIAEQIETAREIMYCAVRLISFELNRPGEVFPRAATTVNSVSVGRWTSNAKKEDLEIHWALECNSFKHWFYISTSVYLWCIICPVAVGRVFHRLKKIIMSGCIVGWIKHLGLSGHPGLCCTNFDCSF